MIKKTRDYFLYRVDSPDRLPPQVREAVSVPAEDIQAIIVVPPQEHLVRRGSRLYKWLFRTLLTPQRTLIFSPTQIVIIESESDGTINTTLIPVTELLEIDLTSVLLFGEVRFMWLNQNGIQTKQVEFNTVGYRTMSTQVNWLRTQLMQQYLSYPVRNTLPLPSVPPDFPLKFRNYLQQGLFPSECLYTVVYQPALRRQMSRLLTPSAPARVLALTDYFFILVEEGQADRRATYGMTLSYVPHHLIQETVCETTPEATWLWLKVGMNQRTQKLGFPLQPENAAAFERGLSKIAA